MVGAYRPLKKLGREDRRRREKRAQDRARSTRVYTGWYTWLLILQRFGLPWDRTGRTPRILFYEYERTWLITHVETWPELEWMPPSKMTEPTKTLFTTSYHVRRIARALGLRRIAYRLFGKHPRLNWIEYTPTAIVGYERFVSRPLMMRSRLKSRPHA